MDIIPFSSLFKKVSIQVDRKSKYDSTETYEWNVDKACNTYAFEAKIPCNENGKPFNAKITLIRNLMENELRFELSPTFQLLFPNVFLVNRSVSEEDIMSVLYNHIHYNNLLDSRDNKRFVKLDPVSEMKFVRCGIIRRDYFERVCGG